MKRRGSNRTHTSLRSGGLIRLVAQGPQLISPTQGHFEKGKEIIEQSTLEAKDVKKNTASGVIKIGSNDVVMGDCFKGPIVINGPVQSQVNTSSGLFPPGNDHEARSNKPDPKYNQPRWCPDGLTHTQKRKLQRLRVKG